MGKTIRVTVSDWSFTAELNDAPTAARIAETLPIEGVGSCWGDEIYFSIPVDCGASPGDRADFEVGDLGYWPPGNAFCIFYGPTPASNDDAPRMASPGTPIGRIQGDVSALKQASSGVHVRLEALEPS